MTGLTKAASQGAIAALAGVLLSTGSAFAADLGGGCCADLEERIAELEVTTVRKGNRRVSLTLSGHVNRSLLYWNDGEQNDVYSVDNAIANAVKHGGATRVQLSAVSSREGVEIAIDDNGTGVPEEERKVVFERFARGSTASHSGSGLGLALVAQQAELHGGTASLDESPLGGARLLLRLPGPKPWYDVPF